MSKYKVVSAGLTDEQIFDIAEPFGAFEFGDAQGDKTLAFARAILAALPVVQGELVGVADSLHGASGFTAAVFESSKVPEGTKLYLAPQTAEQPLDLHLFAKRMDAELEKHDIQGFEPVVLAVAEEVLGYEQPSAPDVAVLVETLEAVIDYLPIGSPARGLGLSTLAAHRKGNET